jgi:hypothetical protein
MKQIVISGVMALAIGFSVGAYSKPTLPRSSIGAAVRITAASVVARAVMTNAATAR